MSAEQQACLLCVMAEGLSRISLRSLYSFISFSEETVYEETMVFSSVKSFCEIPASGPSSSR